MVNNRTRAEHLYPPVALAITQTAMECEPLPPISQQRHQHTRATHRYQGTTRNVLQLQQQQQSAPTTTTAAAAATLINYAAQCSLPPAPEPMVGFYQPYAAQHAGYTSLVNSQDGTTGKLQAASGPAGTQADRDDSSPMVGVCVQQSPVAIH